jgi:hypothetical protein
MIICNQEGFKILQRQIDHYYAKLSRRGMDNMDRYGLASLDEYMTVDESIDSDIRFTYLFREWFKKLFRDKGTLS